MNFGRGELRSGLAKGLIPYNSTADPTLAITTLLSSNYSYSSTSWLQVNTWDILYNLN